MSTMIAFPSIESFRHTIKHVNDCAQYKGLDEDGNAIIDVLASAPTIEFTGTVKLHGTNAGIAWDGTELWAQSRKNVITPEKDNAGFAFFVRSNKSMFITMMKYIKQEYNIADGNTIVVYGEWCGKGIQKGVAINALDKMFVVFKIKIATPSYADANYWLTYNSMDIIGSVTQEHNYMYKSRMYFIDQFPTYKTTIDFNHPELVQDKLIDLTMAVEAECPVGKYFGVSGVGEGIVWSAGDRIFKVKGEKHSVTKVKKLASVDIEKVNSINEFVEYAITDKRLEQAIQEVFTSQGLEPSKKGISAFLSWVSKDVIKEEIDTLASNGLEPKEVNGAISKRAVKWFMPKYG